MTFGAFSSGIVVLFMLVLAVLLTKHYLQKHRSYTLWWSVSFWLAFIAAITDFISYLMHGWSLWQFRIYLFSAATLVSYMGAGTVYLFSQRLGRIYVIVMSLIAAVMLYSLAVTHIPGISHMPPGEQAQGLVPANIAPFFGILSGIGALALFIGALYSWFRSRLTYNLWIAAGALIFSAGGAVGNFMGVYEMFYLFQAIGSVVLYYGIVSSFKTRSSSR